jgi:hypothetical protein
MIVVMFALTATECWALGGFTFRQNSYTSGPYYDTPPPESRGHCVWQRKWTVDKNGHKVLKRIRVCH